MFLFNQYWLFIYASQQLSREVNNSVSKPITVHVQLRTLMWLAVFGVVSNEDDWRSDHEQQAAVWAAGVALLCLRPVRWGHGQWSTRYADKVVKKWSKTKADKKLCFDNFLTAKSSRVSFIWQCNEVNSGLQWILRKSNFLQLLEFGHVSLGIYKVVKCSR